MTIQEEIRGLVIQNIHLALPWLQCDKALDLADAILRTEAAQGVMIQRELEAHEDNYGSYPFEYEPLIEVTE